MTGVLDGDKKFNKFLIHRSANSPIYQFADLPISKNIKLRSLPVKRVVGRGYLVFRKENAGIKEENVSPPP